MLVSGRIPGDWVMRKAVISSAETGLLLRRPGV